MKEIQFDLLTGGSTIPDLVAEGEDLLAAQSLIEDSPRRAKVATIGIGDPVTPLNAAAVRRAELAGKAETAKGHGRLLKRVTSLAAGAGRINMTGTSVKERVEPIFRQILDSGSIRYVPSGEDDGVTPQLRARVLAEPSLMDRALAASAIIEEEAQKEERYLKDQSTRKRARNTIKDLSQTPFPEQAIGVLQQDGPVMKRIGSGLTDDAAAVISGAPRAGTERVSVIIPQRIVEMKTPTRRIPEASLGFEQLLEGRIRFGVKVDPLSRAINTVRGAFGKEPVAVFGIGVLTVENTMSDEDLAGTVVREPFEELKKCNKALRAMRVLTTEPVPRPQVPAHTYADLGLDGDDLAAQSGVEPYVPRPPRRESLLRKLAAAERERNS